MGSFRLLGEKKSMKTTHRYVRPAVPFLFALMGFRALFGGTTGKISGVVMDAVTSQPLVGAYMTITGTSMGAATELDGSYAVLNVGPGIYTIRVAMMGYQPVIVQNVRVDIDQTTALNARLSPTVLESTEAVTIQAQRPLVQMDMTSSMASVNADEIDKLPVQTLSDILEMQAGVVRSGDDLHIRGGRSGEVAYWVDGISTMNYYGGSLGVMVENAAIEQLQVVSGTFNAEYGQAMSGIVNVITKEGGSKYTGEVKAYAGDYMSGDPVFNVLKSVEAIRDPGTGATNAIGISENPLKRFNPTYDGEFTFSGPVPGLGRKLTFFLNGRSFFNEGYLYGRDWYTPQGNPGNDKLVPMNPYRRYSLQGKLTWQVNPNMKLSYNLFDNRTKNDRFYSHSYRYNPYGVPQSLGGGMTHILSLNHLLSPNTFYEFRINRFENETESYVYQNPLAAPRYLVRVPGYPDQGIQAHTLDPSTPEGQSEIEQLRTQRLQYFYFPDPAGPSGYVHPDSNQVPTAYSFQNAGMGMDHMKRNDSYWAGKLDFTSQATQSNQIKAGLEARLHGMTLHSFTIIPKLNATGGEPIVPFEPDIPAVGNVYRDDFKRNPVEFSAYAQDKIEVKNLIVNIGVRYDYFNPNTAIPSDPHDPNIYYPFKNVHRYRNWVDPPQGLSQSELDAYIAGFQEMTPEERRPSMQKNADPKMAVSPRLGIAYPITDQGVIHFSYGHFFQIPNFEYLFANPDFKLSAGGGFEIFGNPDLNPQRTVQYELGLQQQLSQDIGIDATVFYKDIRDLVQTSPLVDTPIPSVKYSMYINRDYGNVRGFTLSLKKRSSRYFSAWLDYTYQVAEGTYSNPNDAYVAYVSQREPRLAMIPLEWDQQHTLNGRVIFTRSDWTVSLVGRYWTGKPYTPTFPIGVSIGAGALKGLAENSARLPSQKSADLFIQKRLHVAGLQCDLFINVYNLFDTRDDMQVYTDTGTADYTTTITPGRVPYNPLRVGTVQSFITRPDWYTAPRWIQAGAAIGF
jgi:outer membrane receptor protein involved in Fe transport